MNDNSDEKFEDLSNKISKMLSEAEAKDDASLNDDDVYDLSNAPLNLFDALWPAAMRCETFFRNSNDIRALELQVELLMKMDNNLYIETYYSDAYTICKRILEIDPNNKKAKKGIENIIPIWDCRMSSDPEKWKEFEKKKNAGEESELPRRTRSETEKMLEEIFKEKKEDNYDYFLDDWEASRKLKTNDPAKDHNASGWSTSSKGRRY